MLARDWQHLAAGLRAESVRARGFTLETMQLGLPTARISMYLRANL